MNAAQPLLGRASEVVEPSEGQLTQTLTQNWYTTLLNGWMKTIFIPVHDGTVRYLKEKGMWTAAHEARKQANIDLLTRWDEAYQTAIDMADEKGISVNPESEERMELWENYKKELGPPGFKVFPGLD